MPTTLAGSVPGWLAACCIMDSSRWKHSDWYCPVELEHLSSHARCCGDMERMKMNTSARLSPKQLMSPRPRPDIFCTSAELQPSKFCARASGAAVLVRVVGG